MVITGKLLSWFGFAGTMCDVLGGLYMGYDLLGGAQGPLGILTRAVTYCCIFMLCYGVWLGATFGLIAGACLGIILALEYSSVARHQRLYSSSPLAYGPHLGALRGLCLGMAAWAAFGLRFGAAFGALCTVGLFALYARGWAPTYDYRSHVRPVMTPRRAKAALLRALIVGAAGIAGGWYAKGEIFGILFGLEIGIAAAVVGLIVGFISPIIEWYIDHMPERQLLATGLVLVFLGFGFQSIQYVVGILGISVR